MRTSLRNDTVFGRGNSVKKPKKSNKIRKIYNAIIGWETAWRIVKDSKALDSNTN